AVLESRAGGSALETENREQGSAGEILRLVQSNVRPRHRGLRPPVGSDHEEKRGGGYSTGWLRRGELFHRRQTTHQFRSRRGPRLLLFEYSASQRRLPAADRAGNGEGGGY